jgi:glycosyltransferase involved in cell wall biosynthesis
MKILFILENYYPNIGGVETLFKSLSASLIKEGHQVTILTNRFDKSLLENETIDGSKVIRVPYYNRYIFTFFAWFKAYKLAKQHDLIHTTSYNAGIPAYIAGLLSRKKVIITFHEVWGKLWFKLPFMSKFSLALHYLFEWFLLKLPFYKFIAVSDATKSNLIKAGVKSEKIVRIYNGIDYKEFNSLPSEIRTSTAPYVFTYFGRLGISKGLDILLKAFHLLQADKVKLKLILPRTPDSLLQKTKQIIKEYNLTDIVNILHELPKSDLISEIKNSNAVVIPSYSEGFCYTAIETMALNIPIITSGQAALSEVTSGKHLMMKDMSPDSLAACLKRAINDDWEFKKYNIYKIEDTVKEYLLLYREVDSTYT